MPYIQCKLRKGWFKVDTCICFELKCPHLKGNTFENAECYFESKGPKKVEKGKKK